MRFPIVARRAFATLRSAAKDIYGDEDERLADAITALERDFDELDSVSHSGTDIFLGDRASLERVQQWSQTTDEERQNVPVADTPESDYDYPDWFSEPAVAGFLAAIAIASLDDDERRTAYIDLAVEHLRSKLGQMQFLLHFVHPRAPRDPLDEILKGLPEKQIPILRHPFDECLSALGALFKAPGHVSGSMQTLADNLDRDNTDRIGGLRPVEACVGQRIRIVPARGRRFSFPSGDLDYTVLFSPCGIPGRNPVFTPHYAEVTVPQDATSGCVYFGRVTEVDVPPDYLGDIAAACPQLAGTGLGNFNLVALSTLPQSFCSDLLVHCRQENSLTVRHPPELHFWAYNSTRAPNIVLVDNDKVELDDDLRFEWIVTSDASGVVETVVTRDGTEIFQTQALNGDIAINNVKDDTVLAITATNECGSVVGTIRIRLQIHLHFEPTDLEVRLGAKGTLTMWSDPVVRRPLNVYLTSTEPAKVGIEPRFGTVLTPQQPQQAIEISGVGIGRPDHSPSADVIAYTSDDDVDVSASVWVVPDDGVSQVVTYDPLDSRQPKMNLVGIHAALLPTGKVLYFSLDEGDWAAINKGKSTIWDPARRVSKIVPLVRNLFCAGHAYLPDGRLLVAGGNSTAITAWGAFGSWLGIHQVLFGHGADHDLHTFNPTTETWTRHKDMAAARWYPTCCTLPNGRVLIVSGYSNHAHSTINSTFEIFDGASNSISSRGSFLTLPPIAPPDFGLYPYVFVLPGNALFVHSEDMTRLMTIDAQGVPVNSFASPRYPTQSANTRTYDGQNGCVLLPLRGSNARTSRVLVAGGGGAPAGKLDDRTPASDDAEIFDYDRALALSNQADWRWTRDAAGKQTRLNSARIMADAVLLPDGCVAFFEGASGGKADSTYNFSARASVEMFDPETETFTYIGSMAVPRLYHSTATLLPDGSVVTAGSTGAWFNHWISGGLRNEYRLEMFYPRYLYRGPVPTISVPTKIGYRSRLTVKVQNDTGYSVRDVVLVRAGSTTHTNNMDQRCIFLDGFVHSEDQVTVDTPADGTLAPPGPYLVFALTRRAGSTKSIPSRAVWTRLS